MSLYSTFYGVARYGGARTLAEQDRLIEKAIADFPAIRERYMRKAAGLERNDGGTSKHRKRTSPTITVKRQSIYSIRSAKWMPDRVRWRAATCSFSVST